MFFLCNIETGFCKTVNRVKTFSYFISSNFLKYTNYEGTLIAQSLIVIFFSYQKKSQLTDFIGAHMI